MEINTPAVIGPGEFFPVVGVGPHEKPWPTGPQYDPELLENGDRRNVLDHYRYWTVEAIVADLNTKRHKLQIAIENWQHDLNIGSIVRTANAFNASYVHIIGKRDWNKRGAMVPIATSPFYITQQSRISHSGAKKMKHPSLVSITCLDQSISRAQNFLKSAFFSSAKKVLVCPMKALQSARFFMQLNSTVQRVP